VKPDEVKATFTDGVLEVRMPLPAKAQSRTRQVEIQDARSGSKPAD
jgi:HSP20 family molecular chaperone IbpA